MAIICDNNNKNNNRKINKLLILLSGEVSNVIRSLDVMTTSVTQENFKYLAFAFISDHLQKDIKN